MEVIIVPISNHPITGQKRQVRVTNFNWDIGNGDIKVITKTFIASDDGLVLPEFGVYEKTLTIDDIDEVDGQGNFIEDPETHEGFSIGQYEFYTIITLAQAGIIDLSTKISEVLTDLIIKNILDSDAREKFNVTI